MVRKSCALVAGWLTLSSAGLAQSNQPSGTIASKVKPLSPYHATASTVDWVGEQSDMPSEIPNVVVPRSAARPVSMQPPAGAPGAPPTVSVPGAVPVPGSACGPQGCGQAPCTTGCCDPCGPNGPCGPQGRTWLGVQYLLWSTKGMQLPALVTSSPLGTPRAAAGVPFDPRTTVLYGNDNVNNDLRSGAMIYSGIWLDECQTCGIDGKTWGIENGDDSATFTCFGNNNVIFARPFVNIAPPANRGDPILRPDSELVCFPNVLQGLISINTETKYWGTEINARKNICCGCDYRVDLLGGYRYMQLEDKVEINENLQVTEVGGPAPNGTTFFVNDRFYSKNQFNGGQLGFDAEVRRGRFYVNARSTVALGSTHSEVEVSGGTFSTIPGQAPVFTLGGLLAQPTNIGTYTFNNFAVVPEGTLNVGYQVTDGIRVFTGYTFLYWSNATRAGDQVDLVVNGSQIGGQALVGAPRPAFVRQQTDFWAQGINFGAEIRY